MSLKCKQTIFKWGVIIPHRMTCTKMLSILRAHEGLTIAAVGQGEPRERWQMQEKTGWEERRKRERVLHGGEGEGYWQKEERSRGGQKRNYRGGSSPQIQKIPQLCRVGSKAQFRVSANLLGSRHYTSDILPVLGGSSSR